MGKTLNNFELTTAQLEKELHYVRKKCRYRARLRNALVTVLVLSAIFVLAVTLWFPVIQVTGEALSPQLESGQFLLTVRTQNHRQGDIIAFYHNNQILIRRVIGLPGDQVHIDDSGRFFINGVEFDEPYVRQTVVPPNDLSYPCDVPDGCIFVMGDNGTVSLDSATAEIGCVSADRIVGKALFCVWPLQHLAYLG